MLLYSYYFRQYGLRRSYQLTSPVLHNTRLLDLPRESVLHYIGDDVASFGIAGDDPILQNISRIILVDYITELKGREGNPRSTYQSTPKMIRDYQRKYRRFRQVKDLSYVWRDTRSILVVDYALLHHLYRYVKSIYSNYFSWKNIQVTFWDTIGSMTKASDRQHFLQCRLPTVLPSVTNLQQAELNFSRTVMKKFTSPESLFILELWKWMGKHRDTSLLAKLTPEQLNKINLVYEDSGHFTLINLGVMDSWRSMASIADDTDNEEGETDSSRNGPISPVQLQKRFLRLLMFLQSQRSSSAAEIKTPEESKPHAAEQAKAPESKQLTLRPLEEDQLESIPPDEVQTKIDTWVDEDLEALDKIQTEEESEAPETEVKVSDFEYVAPNLNLEESVIGKADDLADSGIITAAEYRRMGKLAESYKTLPDPYGKHETLSEQMVIKPTDLKIPNVPEMKDIDTIVDKSMLHSSISHFDRKYVAQILPKDVTNAVMNIQKAGVAVTDYKVENTRDAMNSYEQHTVRLQPVGGRPTTVHFKIPKVEEDGTYQSRGVRYRIRKQRGDLPIRKIGPGKVALTSYYAKLFIERSEKAVNNYPLWLTNQIRALAVDKDAIDHLKLSDVFDSHVKTPRLYSTLAQHFQSFYAAQIDWNFDYHNREKYFDERKKDIVKHAEKDGMLMIGLRVIRSPKDPYRPILVDSGDTLYELVGNDLQVLGTIEDVLGIEDKPPIEQLDISVYGKNIPLCIFLAYHIGLTGLLGLLKVKPRVVHTGERLQLNKDEYPIVFADETLVFSKENKLAAMVLSGFRLVHRVIRNYRADVFDKKDIYFNLMESIGLGVRYLREMDLIVDMFIDPITKEILEHMKEPTDFIHLTMRACELLQDDWALDETDMTQMRIKGYERIAGAVYQELVKAVRGYQRNKSSTGGVIELPPYAVWDAIRNDPSVTIVQESNPIHNLKEKEEVTYTGTGGRSKRSMVRRTRIFQPSDMAVISEATKDSSDTGITTFLTADPNFENLRGLTKPWDGKTEPTKVLSTSSLLAPCSTRDSPKRANFTSIQNSAGMAAIGYEPNPTRTGYEQVIPHRVDDLFAYTAKDDGTITALSHKAVTVTYKDGASKSIELGRRFGTVAGMTMPHHLETPLKEGDKVKKNDIIAFNSDYFKLDPFNNKQAIMKTGVIAKTALLECADTLEDSSVISEETAAKLAAYVTKIRDIVVKFDQSIHNLVKVGDEVDGETILCTLEDPFVTNSTVFDEESLSSLRLLSAYTPRAKVKGKVEKIEVFYNGDMEDMSESLKDVTNHSNRHRKWMAKQLNQTYLSGSIDDSLTVDGHPLEIDHLVIRIYITGLQPESIGDKNVFGNQLKSIVGRVMSGRNETESGEKVDALFSYSSVADRIVMSPEIMGTTNTLLKLISKQTAETYFGKKKK